MPIINPLQAHAVDGLFSTHPKKENRVRVLREMAELRASRSTGAAAWITPRNPTPWWAGWAMGVGLQTNRSSMTTKGSDGAS